MSTLGIDEQKQALETLYKDAGAERGLPESESGAWRYLAVSTDHKVIGLQYLWGIGLFFLIGGIGAMLIRVNLLRPSPPVFSPGQYVTLVGLHGSMMVMMV